MSSTTDGFAIAEEDMKLRGAGDFFGSRQSGLPPLKIADLSHDRQLLSQTGAAVKMIMLESPDLSKYPSIKTLTDKMLEENGTEGMN